MTTVLPAAIFERAGERFVPTGLARGPWHENSQHGSAMCGLLARAISRASADVAMQPTRVSIELLRAAPLSAVETHVQVRHESKSLQLLEATLTSDGDVYARAQATRTRVTDQVLPTDVNDASSGLAFDANARVPLPSGKLPALHEALHLSPVEGFARSAMWIRMLKPLVEGEVDDPLVRTLVAIDWVYACVTMQQWVRDPQRLTARPFIAINTDNHAALVRPLVGEWVGLDATALYGVHGAGAAQARLFDEQGLFGFATQGLLQRGLDKRPKAWSA
jgi:hypothetical protein